MFSAITDRIGMVVMVGNPLIEDNDSPGLLRTPVVPSLINRTHIKFEAFNHKTTAEFENFSCSKLKLNPENEKVSY